MDETMKELERIQEELLEEETEELPSVDDILSDEKLNNLLYGQSVPAFEDPVESHTPEGGMVYHNYANDYGVNEVDEDQQRHDKIVIGLMLAACGLCLGIIGVLGYWLAVIL